MFDQIARQETAPRQHREQSEATAHPGPPGQSDASRPEVGKFDPHTATFNVLALIDNCIGAFSASARDKAIEVLAIIEPDLPKFIHGDPDRIRQILLILLDNAIKFTPRGSVALSVRLGQSDCPQGLLVIEIRDTGIGIPPSPQGVTHSPFAPADSAHPHESDAASAASGLAIVKQLLTEMKGDIRLESRPGGQGTTVTLAIPALFPVKNDHADMPSMPDIRAATVGMSPLYRKALDNMLGRAGIRPTHYANPHEILHRPSGSDSTLFLVDSSQLDACDRHIFAALRRHGGPGSRVVLVVPASIDPPREVDIVLTKPPRQSDMRNILLDVRGEINSPQQEAFDENEIFNARVLLVEDNEINRDVTTMALEILGVTVDVADNGFAAVEKITASNYDLVFMDCQMPIMDGYTATAKIREWEQLHRPGTRVPIVALTAHALSRDRWRCFQHGMDDYVTKPFTLESLHLCLRQWLPVRIRPSDQATSGHAPKYFPSEPTVEPTAAIPAPGQNKPGPPLDPTVITALLDLQRQGSADLLPRLFDAYAAAATELLAAIDVATAAGNLDAVRRHAHTLKSSSHNVGATTLGHTAAALEAQAREVNIQRVREILPSMKTEFDRVLASIAAHRDAR